MKSKNYDEFVEKFKSKLTTDDCVTPPIVYDAVRKWTCKEYGIKPEQIIRPFWPGADYTAEEYPAGCVVLDNPPFSILSRICAFYLDRSILFFLFAPSMTVFSGRGIFHRMNHLICDANIVYENGAIVKTAFVTNLGDGETVAQTAPELGRKIAEAMAEIKTEKSLPKYEYPRHILTAAMMQRYAHYGVDLRVKSSECVQIGAMDAQRKEKKSIFGSGLLLSERAAAERAAAERAAAERAAAERAAAKKAAAKVWSLSDEEKELVKRLSKKEASR